MVSTTSQYITDAPPTSSSEGKNPLALLAKTCETIGLPDAPNSVEKRRTPERKESNTSETKKSPSDSAEKKKTSPRATPTTLKAEPITSTTFPGMPKPGSFPMAFPGMMPFYPTAAGMMSFSMPSFFPMAPFMGRVPCPSAIMRTPCVTPGCTTCTAPDMAAFAANPLFSAYAAMMPTSSAASAMPSYQQLLAAAAASSAQTAAKTTCNWVESTGLCAKQFSTAEELSSHVKSAHAPSPPSAATTPDTKTPSRPRFHPYAKAPMPPMTPMTPMTPFNPLAMQAMYAQRMMGMPHP